MKLIKTKIVFFKYENGGKICLPSGSGYSPHFIVDGSDFYLGVRFINTDLSIKYDVEYIQEIELLYNDKVPEYQLLKSNVKFTIREGNKIVGKGVVL